jgi:WD40 repeat protein
VSTATFSPDGEFIATSDADGDVKLWQTKTRREVRQLAAPGEKLQSVIVSPDGQLLAGSTPGDKPRVYVWNIHDGRLVHKLEINRDNSGAASMAFSPDGKLLATPHYDNTVRLWEIPSGTVKATLKGHIQGVFGVAFSPDGKTLATGGDDRKVKLWNIATLQEVTTLAPLTTGACRSIRFSPDGRTLAVGQFLDPKPYTWLWQVPSFEEIATAEAEGKTEVPRP